MKALIWIGCIFVCSLIQTLLNYAGVMLGGIPTVILALLLIFLPAPWLCTQWDKRKAKGAATSQDIPREDQAGDIPPVKGTNEMDSIGRSMIPEESPPILFCRKCGSKLLPESSFCSKCGVPLQGSEENEMS